LVSVTDESIIEKYSSIFCLPTIEKDPNATPSFEEYNSPGQGYDLRHLTLRVHYPIILKEDLQEVIQRDAKSSLLGWQGFTLEDADLVVDLGVSVSNGSQSVYLKETVEKIEKTIHFKNVDVVRLNEWLKSQIQSYANQRKQQIENRRNLLNDLAKSSTIPLLIKYRSGAPLTTDVTIKRAIRELIPDQSISI
jgi:hypothetical protein